MMQLPVQSVILLASREEMHRVWGRFDHERPGVNPHHLLIVVGLIALALLIGIVWRIFQRRAALTFSTNSSKKLFRELCAAHKLKLGSRRLLRRLAEARGVTSPAMLFVEPELFDSQSLPPELRRSAPEIRLLSEQLFG
jgi:hypothetical protein